jgi:hypothetical protein
MECPLREFYFNLLKSEHLFSTHSQMALFLLTKQTKETET